MYPQALQCLQKKAIGAIKVKVPEDEGKAANQYPIWGTTMFHTNCGPSFLMYPVPFLTHKPAVICECLQHNRTILPMVNVGIKDNLNATCFGLIQPSGDARCHPVVGV